ncbi:hypothetical protein DFH29DRAFT_1004423 [Suillus ampliporus]|nr:hypothetical protein DFH29DRAFT_1004423 [Suillus ampliporus]
MSTLMGTFPLTINFQDAPLAGPSVDLDGDIPFDNDAPLAGPSEPDSMGLYRIYLTRPTFIPPNNSSLVNCTDASTLEGEWVTESSASTGFAPPDVDNDHIFDPFTNPMCGLMMTWCHTRTNKKSDAEVNRLARFHQHLNFALEDVPGFNCAHESKLMDAYLQDKTNPLQEEFGWCQSTITIHLPKEHQTWPSEKHAPELEVPGVYHCSLTSIICSTFKDDISKTFHMMPYSQYWKINAIPHEADDNLERTLTPLMMWSDTTHLMSFGDTSLWPFYMYFDNQSKYT